MTRGIGTGPEGLSARILAAARAFLGSDRYEQPCQDDEAEAQEWVEELTLAISGNGDAVPLSPRRRRRERERATLPEYSAGDHLGRADFADPAFDRVMSEVAPDIAGLLGGQSRAFGVDLLEWAQYVLLGSLDDADAPDVASFAIPFAVPAECVAEVAGMARDGTLAASLVRHGVAVPGTRFALHPEPLSLAAVTGLGCGATHRAVTAMGQWIVDGEVDDVRAFVADMLGSGMPAQQGAGMVGGVFVGVRVLRDPDAAVDFLDGFKPLRTRTRLHDLGTTDEVATWIDAMASTVLDGGHRVEFGSPCYLTWAPSKLSVMLANAELVHLADATGTELGEEHVSFLISEEGEWGRVASLVGESVSDPVSVPLDQLEAARFPLRRELSRNHPWCSVETVEPESFDEALRTYARAPARIPASRGRGAVLAFARTRPGPVDGGRVD